MNVHFMTPADVPVPAVSSDQMLEIDRIAIEETGPNLFQMMENAGRSLASVALHRLGKDIAGPVLVLAGTGGNGGGGICAARHLANRGFDVGVVLTDEIHLREVPRCQYDIFQATPGRVVAIDDLDEERPALVLDALIGYSLSGRPRGAAAELIGWANTTEAHILSLDVPSGLDATTGEVPGDHIVADETMTLALPKSGLVGDAAGQILLADIGIPGETYRRAGLEVSPATFADSFVVALLTESESTG